MARKRLRTKLLFKFTKALATVLTIKWTQTVSRATSRRLHCASLIIIFRTARETLAPTTPIEKASSNLTTISMVVVIAC